jgi:hypothetical protein
MCDFPAICQPRGLRLTLRSCFCVQPVHSWVPTSTPAVALSIDSLSRDEGDCKLRLSVLRSFCSFYSGPCRQREVEHWFIYTYIFIDIVHRVTCSMTFACQHKQAKPPDVQVGTICVRKHWCVHTSSGSSLHKPLQWHLDCANAIWNH